MDGGATFRFDGRQVWYTVHGRLGVRTPVICVPGGPAMPHDYLEPMAGLAASGRPVVFYDPLGSGRSERTERRDWQLESYVDEIPALADALGLERYHLFAHSAAGLAAYTHAVARPARLVGLVLSSCAASIPAHNAAVRPMLRLSDGELERFERAERHLVPRDVRYIQQAERYGNSYLCRVTPKPAAFVRAIRGCNPLAHRALKGGMCLFTSSLETWDITPRLGAIEARTLLTCGRHDSLAPEVCRDIQRRIPRCELEVFEHSAHMPHFEETERYVARVARFLDGVD